MVKEKPPRLPQIVVLYQPSKDEEAISDTHNWRGCSIGAICQDCDVSDDDPMSWQKPCPGKKENAVNETTKIMPGAITHTLLLWESENNCATLVLIPNNVLTEVDFAMFRSVNNKHLNADTCTEEQTEAIKTISAALSMRLDGQGRPSRFGQYLIHDHDGVASTPLEEMIITRVYRTGWF